MYVYSCFRNSIQIQGFLSLNEIVTSRGNQQPQNCNPPDGERRIDPPLPMSCFPPQSRVGGGAKFSGQNSVGSDYGHSQTGFVDGDGEYCCSGQNSGGTEFGHSQTGVWGGGRGGVLDRTAVVLNLATHRQVFGVGVEEVFWTEQRWY